MPAPHPTHPTDRRRVVKVGVRHSPPRGGLCWLLGLALAVSTLPAVAQKAPTARPDKALPATPIYTCVDSQGRRLSSDRPIPECAAAEQRLHNRDGSVKAVVPPLLSPEEAARQEANRRAAAQAQAARDAEARRDRALLSRYPDRATHDLARQRALGEVDKLAEAARRRLTELEQEAVGLSAEREALAGKPMTQALRLRMAANEGAIEAQLTLMRSHDGERVRLNRQFDIELNRLRALWAGAAPGALGPLEAAPTPGGGTSAGPTSAPTRPGPATAP